MGSDDNEKYIYDILDSLDEGVEHGLLLGGGLGHLGEVRHGLHRPDFLELGLVQQIQPSDLRFSRNHLNKHNIG